ncbi:MAG: hypothetical protein ACUVYA_01775 [Planctomycetota bacterium]
MEGADSERCIARVRIGGSVEEVPFAKLSADDLFASAKKHFAGSRAWVGGYIALLAGQAPNRVRRLVYLSNRESPEVRDVLQDLADFEDLLRWGEAAASLRSLSEGYEAASASRDRARSSLEDLRALLARHGASPIVAARRKALRACAAKLLGCLFDPGDRGCLGLRGRIERRDENKIRVTYEFDEPEEQDDFVSDDGYLKEWRRELMESFDFLKPSPESLSSTAIVYGALRTNGQTCFRFALPLEAPFEVKGTLSFGGVKFGGDRPFGGFVLGACDDGRGGNIRCLQTGDILAYDGGEFRQARGQRSADFLAGQPYEFHFVHSGSTAGYAMGNSKTVLAGVENLRSGGLFFWVHSNVSVQIGRLEIEASLTERVVAEMRRRWVGTQLRKIFGP